MEEKELIVAFLDASLLLSSWFSSFPYMELFPDLHLMKCQPLSLLAMVKLLFYQTVECLALGQTAWIWALPSAFPVSMSQSLIKPGPQFPLLEPRHCQSPRFWGLSPVVTERIHRELILEPGHLGSNPSSALSCEMLSRLQSQFMFYIDTIIGKSVMSSKGQIMSLGLSWDSGAQTKPI